MKPFNLKEYLDNPSRKVVTRDRKATARIICTDCKSEYPIIALLSYSENSEGCEAYTADGRFSVGEECNSDLFFEPEKIEGWVNIYKDNIDRAVGAVYTNKEEAEKNRTTCHVATIKITWEE